MPAIDLDPNYFRPVNPGFAALVQPHADALGRIHDDLLQGSAGFLGADSENAAKDLGEVDADAGVIYNDATNEYGAIVTTPTQQAVVASGVADQLASGADRQVPPSNPTLGDTNVPPPPLPTVPPADAFPGTLSAPPGGLSYNPAADASRVPPAPPEPVEQPPPVAGAPSGDEPTAPAPVGIPSAPVNYVTHEDLAAVLAQLETQYVVMV